MNKFMCRECGKEFLSERRGVMYCSDGCRNKFSRDKRKKMHKKKCAICGKEFETTNSREKYCSKECVRISVNKRALEYANRAKYEPRICKHCGKEFNPKTKRSVFCSRKCAKGYNSKITKKPIEAKKCIICSKVFMPRSSSQKYCSEECRKLVIRKTTYKYGYKKNEGVEKTKKKEADNLSPTQERWAKMSLREISAECARLHLSYGQAQVMAQKGTLPIEFGLGV